MTMRASTPWRRIAVVIATGCAILMPLGIILYQSFLDAPFFMPAAKLSLSAYRYVLWDGDFHSAFLTTLAIALGMARDLGSTRKPAGLPDGAHRPSGTKLARARCCSSRSSFLRWC